MTLIRLRDQLDVDVFEYRWQEKGQWTEDLEVWAAQIAEALFGISEADVDDALEPHFTSVFQMMRHESDAYWASHGWDVTDGDGKELRIMEALTRPMVCMVEKLHPDACYRLANEAWEAQLEAEAKQFRPKR